MYNTLVPFCAPGALLRIERYVGIFLYVFLFVFQDLLYFFMRVHCISSLTREYEMVLLMDMNFWRFYDFYWICRQCLALHTNENRFYGRQYNIIVSRPFCKHVLKWSYGIKFNTCFYDKTSFFLFGTSVLRVKVLNKRTLLWNEISKANVW